MKGEPGVGSMWTWTAIDAESKLVVSWQLGARDAANAHGSSAICPSGLRTGSNSRPTATGSTLMPSKPTWAAWSTTQC